MRDGRHRDGAGEGATRDVRPAQPQELQLVLTRRPAGGYVVTSGLLPGWAQTAQGVHGLAATVDHAWRELQIAAYARRRGVMYDLARHEDREPTGPAAVKLGDAAHPSSHGSAKWRVMHNPADWVPLPDGRWRSPSGRVYGAGTDHVRRVIARREALGLPLVAVDVETEEAG